MTGASVSLRASITGDCPGQRIHDGKASRVRDIVHRSVITEYFVVRAAVLSALKAHSQYEREFARKVAGRS